MSRRGFNAEGFLATRIYFLLFLLGFWSFSASAEVIVKPSADSDWSGPGPNGPSSNVSFFLNITTHGSAAVTAYPQARLTPLTVAAGLNSSVDLENVVILRKGQTVPLTIFRPFLLTPTSTSGPTPQILQSLLVAF